MAGFEVIIEGVSTEERNQILQNANQYDLELTFAAYSGDYLSDVKIVINDGHGNEIINTTTAGPLFYAELPTGKYDVKANFGNHTQESKNIQIQSGRRMSRLFHWNVADQPE
jgi:formiminotetrahydrofolate cyclodeaminase